MFSKSLKERRHTTWEWGRNDCCLWAVGVWNSATGEDRAANIFGTYSTWMGCRRMLVNGGGLVNVCRSVMDGARTGETQNGIAVGMADTQTLGAILVDGIAHIQTPSGLWVAEKFDIIEGWGA